MAGLISAFTGEWQTSPRVAEFVIAPIDNDGVIDNDLGGAKILQYWPESIEDSFSSDWQEMNMPGATLPLYQWISGSGRDFSFTAVFTRDLNGEIGKDVEEDKHNIDIDAAIAWLRMLTLNDYQDFADVRAASIAPPVLWIYPVGTKMGYNSVAGNPIGVTLEGKHRRGIYCVLKDVSVTRDNWFQDGTVRHSTASLSFSEVMQVGGGIYPYGRSQILSMANEYRRKPSE